MNRQPPGMAIGESSTPGNFSSDLSSSVPRLDLADGPAGRTMEIDSATLIGVGGTPDAPQQRTWSFARRTKRTKVGCLPFVPYAHCSDVRGLCRLATKPWHRRAL